MRRAFGSRAGSICAASWGRNGVQQKRHAYRRSLSATVRVGDAPQRLLRCPRGRIAARGSRRSRRCLHPPSAVELGNLVFGKLAGDLGETDRSLRSRGRFSAARFSAFSRAHSAAPAERTQLLNANTLAFSCTRRYPSYIWLSAITGSSWSSGPGRGGQCCGSPACGGPARRSCARASTGSNTSTASCRGRGG